MTLAYAYLLKLLVFDALGATKKAQLLQGPELGLYAFGGFVIVAVP